VADGGEHGGDMAVGQRAGDGKGGWEIRETDVVAMQNLAEGFDFIDGPMGEIGDGAVVDLAVFAEALAEEDGGRGVAIGDGSDVHVDILRQTHRKYKGIFLIYMTTS
jgi:hypothetical protein